MSEFDPNQAISAIEKYDITHLHEAPAVLKDLLEADRVSSADFDSIKTVAYCGAPISDKLFNSIEYELEPVYLSNDYGATEVYTPLVALNLLDHRNPNLLGPSNINNQTRVVELRSKNPNATTELGSEGELIVDTSAVTVFDKYWKRPIKTAEAVIDGWYFTGNAAIEKKS
jgi:acyl-coenzyme A synthetase/AMP-(fatty) acid ligase